MISIMITNMITIMITITTIVQERACAADARGLRAAQQMRHAAR
jgi:hypothetical protein